MRLILLSIIVLVAIITYQKHFAEHFNAINYNDVSLNPLTKQQVFKHVKKEITQSCERLAKQQDAISSLSYCQQRAIKFADMCFSRIATDMPDKTDEQTEFVYFKQRLQNCMLPTHL